MPVSQEYKNLENLTFLDLQLQLSGQCKNTSPKSDAGTITCAKPWIFKEKLQNFISTIAELNAYNPVIDA